MKLDIILVKKITLLGLFSGPGNVHRLGVQKRANLEKTSVFLVILTNSGKDMTDKFRKTHAKTRI